MLARGRIEDSAAMKVSTTTQMFRRARRDSIDGRRRWFATAPLVLIAAAIGTAFVWSSDLRMLAEIALRIAMSTR